MRYKLSIKQILSFVINLLAIIVAVAISNIDKDRWITSSFVLYILVFIFNTIIIYRTKRKLLCFPIVYYGLIYLFHLSQIYFALIGYNDFYCVFTRIDFESCREAFTYAFICIHVSMIIYVIAQRKNVNRRKNLRIINDISYTDKQLIKYIFIALYTIKIAIRAVWLYIGLRAGYIALLSAMTVLPSTIIMVADVFSILFLKYCCSKKQQRVTLIVIVVSEAIFMLSGSRILGITYLILILLLVPTGAGDSFRKLSLPKKGGLILLAGGALFLLPTISANRLSLSSESILSTQYLVNSNIINSVIKEFGMTILNTSVAIANRQSIKYLHGLSYFGSIVSLVPNIGNVFDPITNSFLYAEQLRPFFSYSYGGSNIAESFMNFGSYGYLVFIPTGLLLRRIDESIDSLSENSVSKQLFWVFLLYETILWVRSYFYLIVRLPIWTMAVYSLLRMLVNQRKK